MGGGGLYQSPRQLEAVATIDCYFADEGGYTSFPTSTVTTAVGTDPLMLLNFSRDSGKQMRGKIRTMPFARKVFEVLFPSRPAFFTNDSSLIDDDRASVYNHRMESHVASL
ncbi:hypothetical protein L2E82_11021 [Cichorium intybus]|uniref:Uncharacterized protein n=1 Tax=Cichorium intybus TaxID=13427 RepID=A0ACB9GCA1_CICIN|nr:hypothetical protein L2E82_11021 [Cichorium intybus]